MEEINPWAAPALVAAALLLGSVIYIAVRWRRAPAAFRAIAGVASIWLIAGFLFGASVFHFAFVRPAADASKAELEASPTPAPHAESPTSVPVVIHPTRSTQTAIYVASRDRVTTYALGSNGNVAPLTNISGPATGLSQASAIAVDAQGNIYVVNQGYGAKVRINIYAPGSNGDVIPTRTISGPAAELHEPSGIALGEDGRIYITNSFWIGGDTYMPADGDVAIYPPGSNGNVPPMASIVGRRYVQSFPHYWIYRPAGLALDRGGDLYVLNPGNEGITKFRANSYGRTPPLSRIAGPMTALFNARGIALDSRGNIFVTDSEANAIVEYAANATGNAVPLSTISGPSTALSQPTGIALDKDGNIYVTNHTGGFLSANASVTEYPSGSNGNVVPIATISGPLTELGDASGITIGALSR